jgi:hypothetical protein
MVHDALWASLGLGTHDAVYCVGCFEELLGRQLSPADFQRLPVNKPDADIMTDRLLDRLGLRRAGTDAVTGAPVQLDVIDLDTPLRSQASE